MKINLNKIRINSYIFFLAYSIYLTFNIINYSFFSKYTNDYYNVFIIIPVFLVMINELTQTKITKKELILFFFIALLVIAILIKVKGIVLLPLLFLIYGARKIEFEKILKITVIVSSFSMIFVITSMLLKFIPNYISEYNGRIRYYLGFRYSLIPSIILFNITLAILYLNRKKINIFLDVLLFGLNFLMYYYTRSRLSFFVASIIICIFLFIQIRNKKNKIKKGVFLRILTYIFCLCFIFSFILANRYDSSKSFCYNLNEKLEGRIELANSAIKSYGVKWFGNNIVFIGDGLDINGEKSTEKYNYVDNLYINILIKYGLIFSMVIWFFITLFMKKLYKDNNIFLLIIFCGLALRGLVDDLEMYLFFNCFWLCVGNILINLNHTIKRKENETDEEKYWN